MRTNQQAIQPANQEPEQIKRFQTLEPGVYWRAREGCETLKNDRVTPGIVLLLTDIEEYDGQMHTVVLTVHPSWGTGTFKLLLQDFLTHFEPALDGEEVRAKELAALQGKISAAQTELMDGSSNPQLMQKDIENGLKRWEDQVASEEGIDQNLLPALTEQPMGSISTDLAFAIENGVTQETVKAMQIAARREAKVMEIRANWLKRRSENISRLIQDMAPYFEEKASVALAKTRRAMKMAENIYKGLATLDLYTGKCIQTRQIAEGDGAPASEPLTIMQRKLFMDEEFAVWADVGDHFDYRSEDEFFKAIAENAALRDQVLPAARCVVAMAVRRRSIDYGHSAVNARMNKINTDAFLLVRNGGNLHVVYSSQPTHERAARLFPTKNELDQIFRGVDGTRIDFCDLEFTEKASKSEDVALHYKRFLVLLCGLDHRLQMFGTFYDPAMAGKFITLEFQERFCRFIADDEPDAMLGDRIESLSEYVGRMNAYLQSGSRVLCFNELLLDNAPAMQRARMKESNGIYIAYREGQNLCVDIPVLNGKYGWRDRSDRTLNAKVNLVAASKAADSLPFIVLDAVKAEDILYFVHNRHARVNQANYIEIFKNTANHLAQIEVQEAPAREWLANNIVGAGLCKTEQAAEIVDENVRAWRAANRGAALPSLDDKQAFDKILDRIYTFLKLQASILQRLDTWIAEAGVVPLKACVTGRNRLVLYAEVPAEERSNELVEFRWVQRIILDVMKTKLSESSRKLVWLTSNGDASETEIREWDALNEWINPGRETVKLAQAKEAAQACRKGGELLQQFLRTGKFDELVVGWVHDRIVNELLLARRYVPDVSVFIPFAAHRIKSTVSFIGVRCLALPFVMKFGTPEQQSSLRRMTLSTYAKKEAADRRLDGALLPTLISFQGRVGAEGLVVEPNLLCSHDETLDAAKRRTLNIGEPRHFFDDGEPRYITGYLSGDGEEKYRSLNTTLARWVDIAAEDQHGAAFLSRIPSLFPDRFKVITEAVWKDGKPALQQLVDKFNEAGIPDKQDKESK